LGGKKQKKARVAKPAAATPPPKTGLGWPGWLARDRNYYAALFLLALALRWLYIVQIRDMAGFDTPIGDGQAYDQWAQDLAGGDWLGSEPFYQAPLYPYFLGVLFTVFGRDLLIVRLIQGLMGAGACLLLARAGHRFFGATPGRLAGLLWAVYPVAIYFDGLIQKTSLAFLLFALVLFLIAKLAESASAWLWFALGVALGFLGLTRENALILVPIALLWLWLTFRDRPPLRRAAWSALTLAGMFLVFLPATLRNLAVAGQLQISTSNLGPNLYIGNNPNANGRYAPLRWGRGDWKFEREDAAAIAEEAEGRELSPGEISGYWRGRAMDYILGQPFDWLGLMARKTAMTVNAVEIADTEDIYSYAARAPLLRALLFLFHFGVLAPLAAFGIAATWRRWRELWPLYLIILGYAFSVVLFFVFDRFRFPVAGVLILFAAAALPRLRELFGAGARALGPALAAAALTAILANWPLLSKATFVANSELALGNLAAKEGRYAEASGHFERSLALDADRPQTLVALGNALLNLGRVDRAVARLQQAASLVPDFAEAHAQLGLAHLLQQQPREAVADLRRALELEPNQPTVLNNLAWTLATVDDDGLRDGEAAVDYAQRACALTARGNPGYLDTLAAAQAAAGRFEAAIATAEEGLALAREQGLADRAAKLTQRLESYRAGRAIRE